MRRFGALLVLFPCLLMGQSSNPPRYHNTPQQFNFGAPVEISPFVHPAGYTTITDTTQIQPTALIFNTETFGSTGDFTVTGTGQSFSVAGNVGTISASAASSVSYVVTSAIGGTMSQAPDWSIIATIPQKGVATTTNIGEVGGCSPSARLTAAIDLLNGKAEIDANGTMLGAVTYSWPAAPFQVMLMLTSNDLGGADAGVLVNSGSGWTVATSADVTSTFNPAVISNIASFGPCAFVQTGSATTVSWQFSNLVSGNGGGTMFQADKIIRYLDGRPYTVGNKLFLQLTTDLFNGGSTSTLSVDTSTNTGSIVQKLWVNTAGTVTPYSGPVLWNPATSTFSLLFEDFNNSNFDLSTLLYAEIPQSTMDFRSNGLFVIPSTDFTLLTNISPQHGWDADILCFCSSTSCNYNYSTGACSRYVLTYLGVVSSGVSYLTQLMTTTADPLTNPTWTSSGTDTAPNGIHEGNYLVRTRSGSEATESALNVLTTSSTNNFNALYDTSLNWLGQIDAIANVASSVSHFRLAALGPNEYLLSTDGSCFGTSCNTSNGQPTIQSAPINVPSASIQPVTSAPTTSASRSSVTTSAMTILAGCYLAFSHANASGISTIGITSSPSATWTAINSKVAGNDAEFLYSATLAAGSTTFTATPNVSSTYLGLAITRVANSSCLADSSAVSVPASPTQGTLTVLNGLGTTQSDLGVLCTFNFNSNSGISATLDGVPMSRTPNDGFIGCMGKSINGQSSGVTATISTGASGLSFVALWTPIEFTNYAPWAAPVVASPVAGYYATSQTVSLNSLTSGAAIGYTTDGSTPTGDNRGNITHGTTYSSGFSVAANQTVMALSAKLGFSPSYVRSFPYSINPIIQGCNNGSGSTGVTSLTCTFGSAVTAGDVLYACLIPFNNGGAGTWSGDSAGFIADPGAGTPITNIAWGSTGRATCVYVPSAHGGETSITVTGGGWSFPSIAGVEIRAGAQLDGSDNSNSASSGTAATSNSIAPTLPAPLLIAYVGTGGTVVTLGTNVPWTWVPNANRSFTQGLVYAFATNNNPVNFQGTLASSGQWWAHILSFK